MRRGNIVAAAEALTGEMFRTSLSKARPVALRITPIHLPELRNFHRLIWEVARGKQFAGQFIPWIPWNPYNSCDPSFRGHVLGNIARLVDVAPAQVRDLTAGGTAATIG